MWQKMLQVGSGEPQVILVEELVPVMTSNTQPSGEASADSVLDNFYPWKAFGGFRSGSENAWSSKHATGWLQYKFTSPKTVKGVSIICRDITSVDRCVRKFKIQASNDGSTWTDIADENGNIAITNTNQTAAGKSSYKLANNNSYLYYRFVVLEAPTYAQLMALQYYGY